uniref:Uncharacterized protein n=1 Tax=Roseihalotalea indica TaxID=2867963 RepID=A0AA49GLU3_9BACT|nr:hypothetical protein K4G66_21475 [Tunicatimonas sp. TK19036]
MKTLFSLPLFLVSSLFVFGQKKQDVESIKAMCGCYEVSFQYAETFSPSAKYEFHDRYTASALEWVGLVAEEKNKLSLQHILVMHDTMTIKHWRQDWVFENQDLYTFQGDQVWNYETLPTDDVQGQWTQKVYQVDDAPRYEGSATWIHADGKHYWESTVNAPLPRREYTHRDDYNIMQRTNRHEITAEGHVHDQDNAKIKRVGEKERVLAYEKGINTYKKVDDQRCQAAAHWWQKNEAFWADVRTVWSEIFDRHQTLQLETKVNEQRLYEVLFPLNDELMAGGTYDSEAALPRIREVIEAYVIPSSDVAAGK